MENKLHKYLFYLTIAVSCFFLPHVLQAQITINGVSPFKQYVNNLIGNGIIISNIQITCDTVGQLGNPPQMGSFTGGNAGPAPTLGIATGTLLTTGSIASGPGPNGVNFNTSSIVTPPAGATYGGGDVLLDQISTAPTDDACVIEFDLIPYCDSIGIRYVFASHEYPTFVGTSFNDVFAFFISGPNPAGGFYNNVNIALIPSPPAPPNTPVTINNVNNVTPSFPQFYVDNTVAPSQIIAYNGMTTVLVAGKGVIPCQQYHLKIAIADAGDEALDSGVFLEAGGIGCLTPPIVTVNAGNAVNSNTPYAVEGCVDGVYTFTNNGNTNIPVTINYTVSGSATMGLDYANLSGSITIPAGSSTANLVIPAINDGISEGQETIYLIVQTVNCNGASTDTAIMIIQDPQTTTADFAYPDSICVGACDNIVFIGGLNPTNVYTWDFDGGVSCTTNPLTGQGPHTLSWTTPGVKTVCLDVVNATGCGAGSICHDLLVLDKPLAGVTPEADQCLSTNSYQFSYSGSTGISDIEWNFGADAQPPAAYTLIPPIVHYTSPGPKTVYNIVTRNGCVSDTAFITFEVLEEPDAKFNTNTTGSCQGACTSFTYTGTPITNVAQQTYSWDFGPFANPQFSTLQNVGCVVFNAPGQHPVKLVVTNQGICKDSTTQIITVYPNPTVTAGVDKEFCDGAGPIQIDATPSNGTPAYSYSWWSIPAISGGLSSPYIQDPMANPTDTTQYMIQVTDLLGCKSNIDTMKITVHERPQVSAGGDRVICNTGGSFGVFLNGFVKNPDDCPGPYHYSWYPNTGMFTGQDTLPNPYVHPNNGNTIYTLVVIDGYGCSSLVTTLDSASTMTVDSRPVPIVNAGPDTATCFGTPIQLPGYAYNAGPAYTYTWTPNDPQANIAPANVPSPIANPAFTTTYVLTVTSNGCSSSDSVTLTVNTLPTAAIDPPVTDVCQGSSVKLTGYANGDPTGLAYYYSWVPTTGLSDPNSAVTMASPNVTTTYTLYVGTSKCWKFADAITVTVLPTPITTVPTPDDLICYGDTIQLQANYVFNPAVIPAPSPIVIEWTPAFNISDSSAANPFVHPTISTTYVATISVSGQCPTKDSVRIEVTQNLFANATADTSVVCGSKPIQLQAFGGLGSPLYSWSNAQFLNNATIANPIAVIDSNNTNSVLVPFELTITEGFCDDKDTVYVLVHPTIVSDYIGTHKRGCVPLEVNFLEQTQNTIGYVWNFGDDTNPSNDPNPTHIYEKAGIFPVTLTALGKGGCTENISYGTITVTDTTFGGFISDPSIDSVVVAPNAAIQFTDTTIHATGWIWDFGDGITSAERNPKHIYQNPGEYTVTLTVTNEDGCVAHISKTPYNVVAPNLMIPNIFTPNGDNVNDIWEVLYSGKESFFMEVYDRWGNQLFTSESPTKGWNGTMKGGAKANDGVYFYSVKVGEKTYTGNVTLMR